jgi:hypothetical protein
MADAALREIAEHKAAFLRMVSTGLYFDIALSSPGIFGRRGC